MQNCILNIYQIQYVSLLCLIYRKHAVVFVHCLFVCELYHVIARQQVPIYCFSTLASRVLYSLNIFIDIFFIHSFFNTNFFEHEFREIICVHLE